MTVLMEQLFDEVLGYAYVFSTSRWPATFALTLGAGAVGVVLVTSRLLSPRMRRPVTDSTVDT
jgi:hypothetical protein